MQAVSGQSRFTGRPAIVWYIAGAVLLLELLTVNRYGYFGDAMYPMACAEHLAGAMWTRLR